MAQQNLNLGTGANTGTGEQLLPAMTSVQANFTDLYSGTATTGLPLKSTLSGSEVTEIVDGGVPKQTTVAAIGSYGIGNTLSIFPSGDITGVTDDNNIAAAFATMAASTVQNNPVNRVLMLSPGQYYSRQKNVFTFPNEAYFWFYGYGAVITQTATNVGIWEFQVQPGNTPSRVTIEGIVFKYQTQQTSANTNSVCLGARSTDGTSNATTFEWFINRCEFSFGYRGIATTQISGSFPWWGMHIKDCAGNSNAGADIRIVSPTSVGQPNILIEHFLGSAYAGGPFEPSIWIDACDNLTLQNCEMLGYGIGGQSTFYVTASNGAMIACKAETYTASGAVGCVHLVNCSGFTVSGFSMNGAIVNGGVVFFIQGQVAQGVTITNFLAGAASGTGTCRLFAVSGGPVYVVSPPTIGNLGSGPAVFSLQNSGSSASADLINLLGYQAGEMSDNIGDASLTWTGYSPAVNGASNARVNIWNSPLSTNRTITLNGTNGSAAADNLWNGAEAVFIRTANSNDGNSLTVSGTIPASKTIATGSWSKWKWRRSLGWVETESGSL